MCGMVCISCYLGMCSPDVTGTLDGLGIKIISTRWEAGRSQLPLSSKEASRTGLRTSKRRRTWLISTDVGSSARPRLLT